MRRTVDDHPLFLRTPLRTHIRISGDGGEQVLPCSLTHLGVDGCVVSIQGHFTPEQFSESFDFEAEIQGDLCVPNCRARHVEVLAEWGVTLDVEFSSLGSDDLHRIEAFLDQCRKEEDRLWSRRHWRQRRRSFWRHLKHGVVVVLALSVLAFIGSHLSLGIAVSGAGETGVRRSADGFPIIIAPEEIEWTKRSDFDSYLAENLNNMTPEQRQAYFDRLASENGQIQDTATDALRKRLLDIVTYEDAKYVSDRMTDEQRESLRKKFVQSRKAIKAKKSASEQ